MVMLLECFVSDDAGEKHATKGEVVLPRLPFQSHLELHRFSRTRWTRYVSTVLFGRGFGDRKDRNEGCGR